MYDDKSNTAVRYGNPGPLSPVIARFEAWLRCHGYEPHDPFIPVGMEEEAADRAGELVREYLEDRPGERPNQKALLRYALENGEITAVWGDSCGGFAFDSLLKGDKLSLVA